MIHTMLVVSEHRRAGTAARRADENIECWVLRVNRQSLTSFGTIVESWIPFPRLCGGKGLGMTGPSIDEAGIQTVVGGVENFTIENDREQLDFRSLSGPALFPPGINFDLGNDAYY